jgi:hypothetical protein
MFQKQTFGIPSPEGQSIQGLWNTIFSSFTFTVDFYQLIHWESFRFVAILRELSAAEAKAFRLVDSTDYQPISAQHHFLGKLCENNDDGKNGIPFC